MTDGFANGRQANGSVDEDFHLHLETTGVRSASDGLVAGLVRRLTELRLANRELREALAGLDRRYGAAADCFEFSPVACCGLDAEGIVVDINVAGTALFGCSRAAILGRPLEAFIVPEDRDAIREHLRLCVSRRLRAAAEARVLGEDRSEHRVQIVTAPFLTVAVRELAIVALILDLARSPPISAPSPAGSEA